MSLPKLPATGSILIKSGECVCAGAEDGLVGVLLHYRAYMYIYKLFAIKKEGAGWVSATMEKGHRAFLM